MELGLVVLRVVVGGLFAGHGSQKLFGWFGGHGREGTGQFFESVGRLSARWVRLPAKPRVARANRLQEVLEAAEPRAER